MARGRVAFLILGFCLNTYCAAHPYYIGWAEPDSPVYATRNEPAFTSLSRQQSLDRLTALRSVLASRGVTAYIVPTADAHNSQYLAPVDARRQWVSGLSGSAGTALVTPTEALLWTDARYFTQFDLEVNTTYWQLMRQGTDASIQDWLVLNLNPGDVVAADPTTYTHSDWVPLQASLTQANIVLQAMSDNLVDLARTSINDPPPPRPSNPLIAQTIEFSGKQSSEKISDLVTQAQTQGASALVLTALDEVAYTLNLRGTDIPYNPVFFAYLVIRVDVPAPNHVILFWGDGTLPSETSAHLTSEGVQLTVLPYADVFGYLEDISSQLSPDSAIWLTDEASHAIHTAAENGDTRILTSLSPVALAKCVKNDVELAGFHSALAKDSTAIVRFLRWVHDNVDSGNIVTEMDVVDKLEELRSEEQNFMGPSFSTIAGAGENGAVIHYSPSREGEQRVLRGEDMLLVDSGGQYRDGTTDITRTRHLNWSPTDAQRRAFTRVLKGQINLATAVFPKGTVGHTLETLARKSLWNVGLNYGHGTGHGVGHYLKVHEGPSWILSGPSPTDPGIVEGMIFSNGSTRVMPWGGQLFLELSLKQPGYYEVNEYGVRHEDMIQVIPITNDADHIRAAEMVGDFEGRGALGFQTISLVPHQTACLDVSLMTDFEIKYLNDYHDRVLHTIGPILQSRNLNEDYEFLEKECAPIARSAAILLKSTPFLTVLFFFLRFL